MTNAISPNRADSLVEWTAALLFAALLAYAGLIAGGITYAGAGAVVGSALGYSVMRRVPRGSPAQLSFTPEAFDDIVDEADELLLDDPLGEPEAGSRVVKLFASGESSPAALVARIEDYLGRDGDRAVRPVPDAEGPRLQVDASAALHAALSNIRASLR